MSVRGRKVCTAVHVHHGRGRHLCPPVRPAHLEDVGEVAQVEDVVELDGGGQEGGGDALVEAQRQLHQGGRAALQLGAEARSAQPLGQDGGVDGGERVGAREGQRKHGEVALEGGGETVKRVGDGPAREVTI